MKSTIFCHTMSCSPLSVNRRFGGTCRLHLQGQRISPARNQRESRWQAELEAICSSETWVDSQWTTRRYIPEDRTLHNINCLVYLALSSSLPSPSLICIWFTTHCTYLDTRQKEYADVNETKWHPPGVDVHIPQRASYRIALQWLNSCLYRYHCFRCCMLGVGRNMWT
jgi:hypothetical protein